MQKGGHHGLLEAYINKEVIIHHIGGIETQGVLKGYDSNLNMYLVLASRITADNHSNGSTESTPLGAIIIRGCNISAIFLKEGRELLFSAVQ